MMHIHPYERAWVIFSGVLLVVFAIAIAVSTLSLGIQLPGIVGRSVPVAAEAAPGEPWVRSLGPGRYEVNLIAEMWKFSPAVIEVPVGSTVTFYIQSKDIIHGFKITETTVSSMAIPGQVGRLTYTFTRAGEYPVVCHEYCGVGHHLMHGKVVVK